MRSVLRSERAMKCTAALIALSTVWLAGCTASQTVVVIIAIPEKFAPSGSSVSGNTYLAPLCHLDRCDTGDESCYGEARAEVAKKISAMAASLKIKNKEPLIGQSHSYFMRIQTDNKNWSTPWRTIGCVSPSGTASADRVGLCRDSMKDWIKVLNDSDGIAGLERDAQYQRVCLRAY